jgi:D-alanyl-D-alanine carboxypeptidase (penicillin-binding protein 5/6)
LPAVLLLLVAAYAVAMLLRGVPDAAVAATQRTEAFPGTRVALTWPARGEAAVGVEGVGLTGAHGSSRPTPIASIAKVMTAYLVLRNHPLRRDRTGPLITVHPTDVAVYRADRASGQSVLDVQAGERLTERQALEGLLLPSGNNVATLLARWDAGSQRAFVARMNALARALGLAHTHYADASGARAATVSTAADQVRLAMLALRVRAFRQIVAMPQVNLPVAGRQYNVDALLGKDGIVGVKTGSTSQAGGCFVFAADGRVAGRPVTVVGAVFHQLATGAQPSILAQVFHATTSLLASARRGLARRQVVRRGSTLAYVTTPWGDRVAVEASRSVSFLGWSRLPIHLTVTPDHRLAAPLTAGETIGTALVSAGEQSARVGLVVSRAVPGPSLGWRLSNP